MTTMTTPSLAQRLEAAYAGIESSTIKAFESSERVFRDRLALKEAQQAIILANAEDPKKLGSNEAARQATLDTMTTGERDAVLGSEEEDRLARHALDIARIHLEAARAQLRVAELSQPAAR